MTDVSPTPGDGSAMDQQAAAWVLRRDRGLTPAEQDDFSQWLAQDPRHGPCYARQRRQWDRLDQLARWRPRHSTRPNRDLLEPRRPASALRRVLPFALAAAAMIALAFVLWRPAPSAPDVVEYAAGTGRLETKVLPDGSVIELNHGAAVTVRYTAGERHIGLERGEAIFFVTKDPARPFVVNAGGVAVRAVGTTFNVKLAAETVEVLVTEGRVAVDPSAAGAGEGEDVPAGRIMPATIPLLEVRQRAVVSLRSAPAQIDTLTAGEVQHALAWQHRLMDFTAAPLSTIVADFNRRNVVHMVIADPALASIRISASFRSDNLDGFVHLLEAGFGVHADYPDERRIVLRRRRP